MLGCLGWCSVEVGGRVEEEEQLRESDRLEGWEEGSVWLVGVRVNILLLLSLPVFLSRYLSIRIIIVLG